MVPRPLHVVQIGWDTALFDTRAASEARDRQMQYARLLDERRPGSRMSMLVLGAPAASERIVRDNLTLVPIAGRWSGLARLSPAIRSLHQVAPVSLFATQSPLEEAWTVLALARGRVPIVAQVHFDLLSDLALPGGSTSRALAGRARRRLAIALLSHYRAVRTVAPEMADRLRALGARDVRCIPVPILDLDRFRATVSPEREPRVLFVGRLAPEKNLGLWLEVARRVIEVHPAARFDIVGDGPLKDALMAQAQELGLAHAVAFHGNKPRADLPAFYGRASVLLLTSDHEGFGRVLVESLAAGTAVVSTSTSGAREVLADGKAGIIAACGDAAGLADGVLTMLNSPQRRAGLVAAGASRIEGRYDPLRLAGEWIDMLVDAAERPLSVR